MQKRTLWLAALVFVTAAVAFAFGLMFGANGGQLNEIDSTALISLLLLGVAYVFVLSILKKKILG